MLWSKKLLARLARFDEKLAKDPKLTLRPGEGCRVFHQRAEFMLALGFPVLDGNYTPAAPSCW